MASASPFNFESIMPGFDFLKQFAAAGGVAGMPQAAQWVTPTLDPKELEKRIQVLKSVQFWLDQNAKALSATIQALEVQRMTLETLQGMNLGVADVAAAMTGKAKAAQPVVDPMQWWGSLTQQFQNIAAAAVKDVAAQAMKDKPRAARKTKSTPSKSRPSRAKKTAKPAAKPAI